MAYSADSARVPPLLAGLCVLKVIDPALYIKAKNGALSYTEAASALRFDENLGSDDESGKWALGWWAYSLDPNAAAEIIQEYGRNLGSRHQINNRRELVPYLANNIVDRFIPRG